ncbi:MAG TPA: GNAT family N-acetyltransferase [Granulicella sp.]|jgi:predicted GNAT superfamily acetyltransferase|nr:GNAT family N-acetyltransferase [Granulicella sp.]
MPTPTLEDISIAHCTQLDEFERCVELQGAVWGYDSGDLVPRRLFLLASKIGGQVIGGFNAAGLMVGFAMALPGVRDGGPYLHSHMLAVLPEYRNAGLGRSLKLAQRDDALARGFALMEWTFDPLEIKNAYLNIIKLGAVARRYAVDFYGPSSSPLQAGLPTDRLYAEWWLRSPRVEAILGGEPEPVVALERIEVPHRIAEWKRRPEFTPQAAALQLQIRHALQAAFARGLSVLAFERDSEGNGTYLLGREAGNPTSAREAG